MDKKIHLEGDNFLTLIKSVPFNGYEKSKNNVLYELTTFTDSKFVITPDKDNVSPLSVYSKEDYKIGPSVPGTAKIYEVTSDTNVDHMVLIHQGFFKLSVDGGLRKLGFQVWQMEEVITKNGKLFPKGGDWIAFFLIESGNGIYPISVRPFSRNHNLYEIGLESLSDLSQYACIRPTFFVGR